MALFVPVGLFNAFPDGHWLNGDEQLIDYYKKVWMGLPSGLTMD